MPLTYRVIALVGDEVQGSGPGPCRSVRVWKRPEFLATMRLQVSKVDIRVRPEGSQGPSVPGQTVVRERRNSAPCRVLGRLVRETDKSFVYIDSVEMRRTARKNTNADYHALPCAFCPPG